MKLLAVPTFVVLSVCTMAAAVAPSLDDNFADFPAWVRMDRSSFRKSLSAVSREESDCTVNVCWAIDGSGSISTTGFSNETNFVTAVSANLNLAADGSKAGAVQYATTVKPIRRLTDKLDRLVRAVNKTEQMGGFTNVDGALLGCRFILQSAKDEARHIILLTDGDANIGAAGFEQAAFFRGTGGRVSIVAAGRPNQEALQRLAGPGEVFNVNSYENQTALLNISGELRDEICDY